MKKNRILDLFIQAILSIICIALFLYIRYLSEHPIGVQSKEWCTIAGIGGIDRITNLHLYSLMKSHGIICTTEGSVGYSVMVPPAKRSEAIEIIKEDLKKRKYYINLDDHAYRISKSDWRESEPKARFDELLPSYSKSTDLGALLRSPEFMNKTLAFPYVMKIRSLEREYLDEQQKIHIGHEFKIELAVKPDERIGRAKLYFQVFDWDSKKNIEDQGGSEFWNGSSETVETNQIKYDKRKRKDSADVQKLQQSSPSSVPDVDKNTSSPNVPAKDLPSN